MGNNLSDLKGPDKSGLYIRPASRGVAPIWYRWDGREWFWTPYDPYEKHSDVTKLWVSVQEAGQLPAKPNADIIVQLRTTTQLAGKAPVVATLESGPPGAAAQPVQSEPQSEIRASEYELAFLEAVLLDIQPFRYVEVPFVWCERYQCHVHVAKISERIQFRWFKLSDDQRMWLWSANPMPLSSFQQLSKEDFLSAFPDDSKLANVLMAPMEGTMTWGLLKDSHWHSTLEVLRSAKTSDELSTLFHEQPLRMLCEQDVAIFLMVWIHIGVVLSSISHNVTVRVPGKLKQISPKKCMEIAFRDVDPAHVSRHGWELVAMLAIVFCSTREPICAFREEHDPSVLVQTAVRNMMDADKLEEPPRWIACNLGCILSEDGTFVTSSGKAFSRRDLFLISLKESATANALLNLAAELEGDETVTVECIVPPATEPSPHPTSKQALTKGCILSEPNHVFTPTEVKQRDYLQRICLEWLQQPPHGVDKRLLWLHLATTLSDGDRIDVLGRPHSKYACLMKGNRGDRIDALTSLGEHNDIYFSQKHGENLLADSNAATTVMSTLTNILSKVYKPTKPPIICLYGNPGTGKNELVRFFAREYWKSEQISLPPEKRVLFKHFYYECNFALLQGTESASRIMGATRGIKGGAGEIVRALNPKYDVDDLHKCRREPSQEDAKARVLFFDEFNRANTNVLLTLGGLFEDGNLVDNSGAEATCEPGTVIFIAGNFLDKDNKDDKVKKVVDEVVQSPHFQDVHHNQDDLVQYDGDDAQRQKLRSNLEFLRDQFLSGDLEFLGDRITQSVLCYQPSDVAFKETMVHKFLNAAAAQMGDAHVGWTADVVKHFVGKKDKMTNRRLRSIIQTRMLRLRGECALAIDSRDCVPLLILREGKLEMVAQELDDAARLVIEEMDDALEIPYVPCPNVVTKLQDSIRNLEDSKKSILTPGSGWKRNAAIEMDWDVQAERDKLLCEQAASAQEADKDAPTLKPLQEQQQFPTRPGYVVILAAVGWLCFLFIVAYIAGQKSAFQSHG